MVEMMEKGAPGGTTAGLTGADLVVETLEQNGVDTVFGIPGVHTLALYDALHERRINHVLARHEQGAGFMADGYARASGKPGVAFIITGPGITNVATPIGEAYTDGSPVFVVSANVERPYLDAMRGNLHDLKDQLGLMAAVTQWNSRVMDPADAPEAIAEGLRRLTSGRTRPVHVEVPLDVLDERITGEVEITLVQRQITQPDPEALQQAVDALRESERVVTLAILAIATRTSFHCIKVPRTP